MAKIKKRKNIKKTTTKTTSSISRTASKKSTKKTLKKNAVMLPFILVALALTILTLIILGPDFAILIAAILGIVLCFIAMLNNIKNNKRRRRIMNAVLILLLTFAIIGVVGFCAFIIYIKSVADPKFKTSKLNTSEISILYDKDDRPFAELGSEQREKVTYDELPQVLVDAIIATEDSRYYSHNGFDTPRFIRAALGQIIGKSDAGGASTLSMQVVKNSFTDAKATSGIGGVIRKFEDIYLAVYKLEKKYTKEEIIEYYVNNHFLGGNIYGVEEASQAYFGKSVSDLNLSEAATIAGMFKSPNYYRPTVNPKNATARRSTVLYLMEKHGYITSEEADLADAIPMEQLTNATATQESPYQGYIDMVVEEIKDTYGVNPYTTSLKVYTTLDRSKQDAVDRVMNGQSSFQFADDQIDTGVAVLDVKTGAIQAVAAGRHRQEGASMWNNATDIRRQPGSSAKPLFDYGPGIEYNNWSTATSFVDAPYTYSNGQRINNWDNSYMGTMTLRQALSKSRNIPALKAFQQVDKKKIIEFVTNLGIEPEIENGTIHEAHSIGAFTGVSPLQMAGAYAAFANGGYYNTPYSVRKIEYRLSGETEEHKSDEKKVMSDATAFMITSVLQDVKLNGNGGTPYNVAVKTGTTNYDDATKARYGLAADAIRDSWAVGYSTKTVVAMWVGYQHIDSNYYAHNLPGSIAKDYEYRAFINEGAMEADRESFVAPASVVKIGGEYYKKGYEPKQEVKQVLGAPGNISASYSGGTLTLSWNAVGRLENDGDYGEFGYKVYRNGTYVGWTTNTSYTFNTTSPDGTYKVQASYKGYSGVTANSATYVYTTPQTEEVIENPDKPDEPDTPEGGEGGDIISPGGNPQVP